MKRTNSRPKFAVCVKNDGYEASLELWKIYRVLPDSFADEHKMIRVVDESGEDYLYPGRFFTPIEVPKPLKQALATAIAD